MVKRKYVIVVSGLGSRTDTKDIMSWLKKHDKFEKGIAVPTYSIGKNTIWSDYWIFTKEISLFDLARLFTWMSICGVGSITEVRIDYHRGQNPKDYYTKKE